MEHVVLFFEKKTMLHIMSTEAFVCNARNGVTNVGLLSDGIISTRAKWQANLHI